MTVEWLTEQNFDGFIRFDSISQDEVPVEQGVYAVVRESTSEPRFLTPGRGRKGSHYPLEVLQEAWVPDAQVLYFGKAQCKLGIFERLRKYSRFGEGKRSGHSGGRAIWQLEDASDLKVCWLVTSQEGPVETESALIQAFRRDHSEKRPFANRIDGRRAK